MTETALQEHAHQFGEAMAALIKMEGMKAQNDLRKYHGGPPEYLLEDFENVIAEHDLDYNALIEKRRKFF